MDVFPCCEQLHALCPVPLDFCNRVVDTKKAAHRKGGAQRAVIKNCLQYISTHLREDLRLEELAHECGLLTCFIRRFGSYPEGVCYSILIMNCTTWLLDKYVRPTIYGAAKKAKKEATK